MRFSLQIFLSCLLFSLPHLASAQSNDPARDVLLSRLKAHPQAYTYYLEEKIAEAIQELQSSQEQFENDAQFFNLMGVLQLKHKNFVGAATSFERAVLIEPNNAGAWLDLAIASLESGNYESATSYFDFIELNFHPPETVKKLIASYKKRMHLASMPPKYWQNLLEFQVGRDTNANSGLQSAFIPVTLNGSTLELPLDPAFKARADNYAQLSIGTRYRRISESTAYDFSFSAKHRGYKQEHAFTSTDFSSGVGMQSSSSLGVIGINAYGDFNSLAGKGLMRNVRVNTSLERAWKTCRYGFGAEVEWRRYVSLAGLNANVSWMQVAGACEHTVNGKSFQLAIIGRLGLDQPIATRAGGTTRRKELVVQLGSRLFPRLQADASVNFSNAYDSEGYSALLDNNANRNLYRRNYRLQFTTPLDTDLDLTFRLDRNTIQSNLLLFQQSGNNFNLGLQRRF